MKHMTVLGLPVLLFALFLSSQVQALRIPDSSPQFAQKCVSSPDCDLMLFEEFSKLYRAPKEEVNASNYIWSLKLMAENYIWKQTLWSQRDALGNILIRIPPTGKYAYYPKAKHIALQAHMDMVLAYADAKPGEDIRKYFFNGVSMETINGWIYSKGKKTTLGADNGIGVAYALKYLLNKNLPHPPLELVFTVQEEIGLIGALAMDIPLLSRRMLCFDGMTPKPNMVIGGAQGGTTGLVSGTFKGEMAPGESLQIKITLTGLAGGHSGGDIHLKRLNGIKGFAELYEYLSKNVPEIRIQSVVNGNLNVYNQIPNLFSVTLSVRKAQVTPEIKTAIQNKIKSMVEALPDENKNYALDVQFIENAQPMPVATLEQSQAFIKGILAAPNGVLETGAVFPNQIKTSSNLSFWGLQGNQAGEFASISGFFSRSFTSDGLNGTASKVSSSLLTPISSLGNFKVEKIFHFPPWLVPSSSTLMKQLLAMPEFKNGIWLLSVGLEPSAFIHKYQDMDVVAIGPTIYEAHTVNERLELESVPRISQTIQKILESQ